MAETSSAAGSAVQTGDKSFLVDKAHSGDVTLPQNLSVT